MIVCRSAINISSAVIIQMTYQAIESIDAHLQEELLEAYELFDNRGKGRTVFMQGILTPQE